MPAIAGKGQIPASLNCVKREEMPEKSKQLEGFAGVQILGKAGGKAIFRKKPHFPRSSCACNYGVTCISVAMLADMLADMLPLGSGRSKHHADAPKTCWFAARYSCFSDSN